MNRLKDTVLKPVGDQFDRLTELILRQLSITRQLLAGNSSAELRDELNRNESAIDGLEVSIRDEVVNVIVLHAPRASNLRIIMACYDTTSHNSPYRFFRLLSVLHEYLPAPLLHNNRH